MICRIAKLNVEVEVAIAVVVASVVSVDVVVK